MPEIAFPLVLTLEQPGEETLRSRVNSDGMLLDEIARLTELTRDEALAVAAKVRQGQTVNVQAAGGAARLGAEPA